MGRRPTRVNLDAAASGAGEGKAKDKDWGDSFDELMVGHWMRWRASYPVRGTGGVILIDSARPSVSKQKAWHHYVQRNENGRVRHEWWMPPFLVPLQIVSWVPGAGAGDEILKQCSVGPACGGRPAHQHYTNVSRICCLARSHPKVVFLKVHRLNAWARERGNRPRQERPPEPIRPPSCVGAWRADRRGTLGAQNQQRHAELVVGPRCRVQDDGGERAPGSRGVF